MRPDWIETEKSKSNRRSPSTALRAGFRLRSPRHPSDEDLSLHPSEQKSLAGDPESLGAPVARPPPRMTALWVCKPLEPDQSRRSRFPPQLYSLARNSARIRSTASAAALVPTAERLIEMGCCGSMAMA
jgi:hypothetical protein